MVRVRAHGGQHIKKSASYPFAKVMFLTETCFFLNFSRFSWKYPVSVKISSIYSHKEGCPISLDLQRLVGDYSLLTFFPAHQVDELRNQKCGTHIKKLTAMKFRNLKKLSYRSNQLEKAYSKKIKTGSRFKNRIIAELFFYFFIFFSLNFFVFENFKNPKADSERQYPT